LRTRGGHRTKPNLATVENSLRSEHGKKEQHLPRAATIQNTSLAAFTEVVNMTGRLAYGTNPAVQGSGYAPRLRY
jgi:hypothetical protein